MKYVSVNPYPSIDSNEKMLSVSIDKTDYLIPKESFLTVAIEEHLNAIENLLKHECKKGYVISYRTVDT